jgi:DNA-binding transcriptional regulator YiaG
MREMVHQLKEMSQGRAIVKCGLSFPKNSKEWSGWASRITCQECVPDLRIFASHDIIDRLDNGIQEDNKENETMAREPKTIVFDKDTMAEVKNLRDNEGMKWSEIAESLSMSAGKAILIYNFATVSPKDRIKDITPAQVRALRDNDNLSWGVISSRTALSEATLRSMYEEAAGRSARGTRIGKGGRYPGDEAPPETEGEAKPAKKAAAKKTAAKKTAAKKTAAPKVASPLKGLKSQEIKDKITGYAVKYNDETIAVREVKNASATAIVLVDSDGKARTLKTAGVTAVSSKKVLK